MFKEQIRYNMKTYYFDQNGLRFSNDYLNGIKNYVLGLSLEEQSEFVDSVTYRMVKNSAIITNEIQIEFARVGNLTGWNTTSIGNLAYTALFHPDATQRERAKELIELIKKQSKCSE